MLEEALRSIEEVLHLLGRHGHCKAVVSGWQAGNEDLSIVYLACVYVNILHLAPGIVEERLFTSHIEILENRGHRLSLRAGDVPVQMLLELCDPIRMGRLPTVLLPQQLHGHMRTLQLGGIIRQPAFQLVKTAVSVGGIASHHAMGQHWVVKGQQLVNAHAVLLCLVYILVHCVLVEVHCLRDAAV